MLFMVWYVILACVTMIYDVWYMCYDVMTIDTISYIMKDQTKTMCESNVMGREWGSEGVGL